MANVAYSTATVSFNSWLRYVPVISWPTQSFSTSSPARILLDTRNTTRQCRRNFSLLRAFRPENYASSNWLQQRTMQILRGSPHCLGCTSPIIGSLPILQCSSFATLAPPTQAVIENDATVQYRNGLPVITLTLPSRGDRCEFALRPVTQSVADLCDNIRREDGGIEIVELYSLDGTKIAGSTSIEHLLQSNFHIRLNDRSYLAQPPKDGLLTAEHLQQLSDVKALVASLYASLNAEEQCLRNERELAEKLETVRKTLEPLEKQKELLAIESEKRTNRYVWLGLALMGIQCGAFARLTWFEYSWDIMEPVTYFATYTAVIGGYAYFAATRIQYEYPDAKERIGLNKFYKLCRKRGFDVEKYNRIKETVYSLEQDLDRLRRSSGSAPFKIAPLMEQTITVVRDVKSTAQATGSKIDQKPVADMATSLDPTGEKKE